MEKTPELIIAEFESRQDQTKRERRWKSVRQSAEILRTALVAVGIWFAVTWGPHDPKVTSAKATFVIVIGFIYLMHELQRRWAIEDELKRLKDILEKKA